MKEKNYDIEIQTIFHMVFITVLSMLAILLMVVMAISDWKFWQIMCPVVAVAVLSCWLAHFFQIGSSNVRVWFYAVIGFCGVLYYGAQGIPLTDIPIIICLFIIILSMHQDMKLIYFMSASYPIVFLWNFFVTGYVDRDTEQLIWMRIILGVVCLLCAIFISRFLIRKQKQERMLRYRIEEELKESNHRSEMFLVNVSHELRTPINAVNGMSEIILHQELENDLLEKIESIQNAGKRLYGQVSDILDYSELITNTLVVSEDDYEPVSMIHDAISGIQWNRMDYKLDIAIDIQPDIPRVLHGDAGKLKKIIQVLMDNVIKFTESGGAYLYIGKREEGYGINLNIDVWDTGIGMSEEQLKHIFTDIYKGDSDFERKTGGLGLGLAIVHGMVAAMGGFVSIESKVSEGTHVHVVIPQQVVDKKASISVKKNYDFQIACYFNAEKYVRPEIAQYYGNMIEHIGNGLGLNICRADSLDDLKKIVEDNPITHVFIASWEYEMDRKYFEGLSEKVFTVIFAENTFILPKNSNIYILQKPVYLMAVVNLLNVTMPGSFGKIKIQKQQEEQYFTGVKALVVDDDHMNLMVAKGVLKTYGIEADTCLSGELAIDKCVFADYQIIFMDHMMPGMNGIVAMQKIRELRNGYYKNIPIVVLTANAVSGAREMFIKEGFDEFISKPIELSAMSRTLRKMLKGKEDEEKDE